MAEKKLVDKLNKYSKHRNKDVFYEGEKQANIFQKILKKDGHYNGRYTEFGGISLIDLKKAIKNSAQKLSSYAEFNDTIADLQTNGFLKDDFLDRCRGKELKRIYKVLSKMNLFMRMYAKKAQSLSSPNADSVKQKYLQAIKCYKDVLKFGNEGLLDLEKLENFDTDAFAKDIDKTYKDFLGKEQSSNLNRASMRDLEVVRALEYTGIYLKREIVDGKTIWAVDMEKTKSSSNTNGIAYLDENNNEQHFRLSFEGSDSQIQSFLNEYLNKDEKDRNGAVITPEGIFKLYVEESTSSIKTFMGHVFGFGRDNKEIEKAIEETRKRYSVNNPEWQAFSKSSERIAVADASKLALVDLFIGRLSSRQEIVPEEVQTIIQNNDLVNDKWVNKFLNIGDRFNDLSDSQISEAYDPANDIVSKYITARNDVEARLRDSHLKDEERVNLENSLKEIEKSIATLNLVREFELKFVEKTLEGQNLEGEALRNQYVEIIKNLSECDFLNVKENEPGQYELFVNEDIKTLPENIQSLCNTIVKEVNATSVKLTEDPENESADKELTDDKLLQLILENVTDDSNNHTIGDSIEAYEILKRAEFLTSDGKDNEILDLFKKYRELKEKNPDAIGTLEEFITNDGDKFGFGKNVDNALFTGETLSIVEALSRSKDPEYRKSADYQNALQKRNKIVNNANMYYVLVDRIGKNLKAKNLNLTDENLADHINAAFIETTNGKGIKGLNDFNTTPEEIMQARAKYEGRFHRNSLANAFNEALEDPNFESSRLNQDLMGKMKQVFGEDFDKDKIEPDEKSNLDEEIKKIKFSDKYPKKDETALLKKFKPYCAKSTSKIIENLQKMILGIDITIKNPSKLSSVSVTNSDDEKISNNDNKENPTDRNADDGKGTGDEKVDDGNSSDGQEDEESSDRPVEEQDQAKGSESEKSEEEKSETGDEKAKDESDPEKSEDEKAKEQTEAENDEEKSETGSDKKQTTEKQICHNVIDIPDRQFATYRMLAVGLQAILKTPPFEKSRELLNSEEKSKLDSLSKVLNYIISEPKDKEEADFKNFLAWEIDYKSRTVDGKYNADTRINNSEFFKSEFPKYAPALVEDINNVIFNLKNIEELGAIIGITTDRTEKNPEMGNKLTDEDVEKILKSKDRLELWEFIKSNNNAKTGLCETPVVLSSELTKIIENEIKDSQNNQDCDMGML